MSIKILGRKCINIVSYIGIGEIKGKLISSCNFYFFKKLCGYLKNKKEGLYRRICN